MVQVGENAAHVVAEQTVTLTGDVVVTPLSLDSPVADWFGHPVVGPVLMRSLSEGMTEDQRRESEKNADMLDMVASLPMRQFLAFVSVSAEDLEAMIELSEQPPA